MMSIRRYILLLFFFFNDTATTEIYTLSLHDALPIWLMNQCGLVPHNKWMHLFLCRCLTYGGQMKPQVFEERSEEHTSELQSQSNLVCRLLLEKKKKKKENIT